MDRLNKRTWFLYIPILFVSIACQPLIIEIDDENNSIEKNIVSIDRYMVLPEVASRGSRQGSALWDNTLFIFHDTNDMIEVYDFEKKSLKSIIKLDGVLYNPTYHCNNVCFSNQKYALEDTYPLLYVSMEHIKQHKILVLRVIEHKEGFGFELIQSIFFPDPQEISLFYPNSYLDCQKGLLWASGYTKIISMHQKTII